MKASELARIPKQQSGMSRLVEYGFRFSALLLFVLLFIPQLNPARISERINVNLSLFTSGFFYDNLIAEMGRMITRGWIQESTMQLLYISAMVASIGVLAITLGASLSLGNNKLKRISVLGSAVGSLFTLAGLAGMAEAYLQIKSSAELDKALPLEPTGQAVLLVLAALAGTFALLVFLFTPKPAKTEKAGMEASMELFLMLMPFILLVFVFSYLPLWGWRYGFYNFVPGQVLSDDKFVGFFWFTYLFQNEATRADLVRVVVNTLVMSGLGILTSWVPLAFAIFLSEIRSTTLRRVIQTLTTIPNFISWVLIYAVAFSIFATDGFVSSIMVNMGSWESGRNLLMGEDNVWLAMLGWGMWKGLGWGAIMYIAAISAIDPQLYEAATVDGAGRFQKMWHITIPELMPTFMVMLLLSIAGILNNGMEQYLVFENPTNTGPITVLDLYVYKLGIGQGIIPLSTVVGMVKSLISVALLFGANAVSKAVRGSSIV